MMTDARSTGIRSVGRRERAVQPPGRARARSAAGAKDRPAGRILWREVPQAGGATLLQTRPVRG